MPNRIIKESIKTSDNIDRLTWFEEVVFYRLVTTVDDYGCYDGRVIVLKNELFPTKETVTKKQIEDAIAKLESVGLLIRYEHEGRPYIYLLTWDSHQRVRNKHRKYPEPPSAESLSAIRCQMSADGQSESNPIQSESNPNPNIYVGDKSPNTHRFVKPSVEEVRAYCEERNNGVDPQRFVDFYEAKGWLVGKTKMKDWKACVRTWEKNSNQRKEEWSF